MYIIIDGSSMLSTNYYGSFPRSMMFAKTDEEKQAAYQQLMQAPNGKYTNGVYLSLKQILKMRRDQKPEGIIVVLDRTRNTFRREVYAEYKANRSATPAPLEEQFITFAEVLNTIGIPVFYSNKYEADDLAGAIAKTLESAGKNCVLISGDKDYYQLVSPQTSMWRILPTPAKKKYEKAYGIDMQRYQEENHLPAGVFEIKNGEPILVDDMLVTLTPAQFIDYLAMVGDKADNIPGVHGVGAMTIVPLLKKYGSMDGIYDAIQHTDAKALAEQWKTELGIKKNPIGAFVKEKENAYLSKTLATIKTNIDEIPKDYQAYNLNINMDGLQEVIREYALNSLIEFI